MSDNRKQHENKVRLIWQSGQRSSFPGGLRQGSWLTAQQEAEESRTYASFKAITSSV